MPRCCCDLVVRHRDQLRAWVPDTVESRTLQALCEQRRKLVNHRVALTNRLTSLLKQYFPQALDWVGELASPQGCDFLTQWPTLAAVQRARPRTVRQFYRAHNCRNAAVIDARLTAIAAARPLTTDAAVVEPLSLAVQGLRDAIAHAARDNSDRLMTASPPSLRPMRTTPSSTASPVPARSVPHAWPRPLGPIGPAGTSAADLQSHSGIAPVTERSGKSSGSIIAWPVPNFVKQTFHEFADQSIRFSRWARVYYDQQRGRGNEHHAALRALAYKWIRILFRCWKERRPYDEETYIARFAATAHRWRNILLDGPTQMSMPPAPSADST